MNPMKKVNDIEEDLEEIKKRRSFYKDILFKVIQGIVNNGKINADDDRDIEEVSWEMVTQYRRDIKADVGFMVCVGDSGVYYQTWEDDLPEELIAEKHWELCELPDIKVLRTELEKFLKTNKYFRSEINCLLLPDER